MHSEGSRSSENVPTTLTRPLGPRLAEKCSSATAEPCYLTASTLVFHLPATATLLVLCECQTLPFLSRRFIQTPRWMRHSTKSPWASLGASLTASQALSVDHWAK